MPCTQTGSLEGDHALALSDIVTEQAEMLCKMCQLAEDNNLTIPHGVRGWWTNHKKLDAKRRKQK
jgi:hypothetical protein